MSLTIYNSIWGFVKFIFEPYLERRVKKGKEDVHRINERYGISNKIRPKGTLIWLHGTSVGESVAALALANSMKKNGFGKQNYLNGSIYEGEWKDDKYHGQGTFTFANGIIKKGLWKNDEFVGE